MLTIDKLRMIGHKLTISEVADLFVKSVVWEQVTETTDFEVIEGEDNLGTFILIKGMMSGEGLIIRE